MDVYYIYLLFCCMADHMADHLAALMCLEPLLLYPLFNIKIHNTLINVQFIQYLTCRTEYHELSRAISIA